MAYPPTTKHELKTFLQSYRTARQDVVDLTRRCERMPMAEAAIVAERLSCRRHDAECLLHEVLDMLELLPPGSCRRLLELRYIDALPWEVVAMEMHYDIATCHRKHNVALDDLLSAAQCAGLRTRIQPPLEAPQSTAL